MSLQQPNISRHKHLNYCGQIATASVLAGMIAPRVHAGEDNTIRLALIGCGGRGAGAAANALEVPDAQTKLTAMADVFPQRLSSAYAALQKDWADRVDVPEERRFIGFDAYRNAMDCLRPGDVAILTTPPAFRWVHFSYAIQKGLHVFMEKPTTVDGPSTRKMLALAEESEKKNLKVGVGLMFRHCTARNELYEQVRAGAIGQIVAMRSYRMHGPIASFASERKPEGISELLYQIERFHSFLWASGGCFSDFNVHGIDECCWMKDAWPVQAQATGSRHYRGNYVDQNFDQYSVEYTFADGTKLYFNGRCISGCSEHGGSYLHGTKGLAVLGGGIYKGYNPDKSELVWSPSRTTNNYMNEWVNLISAIRQDKPFNEARRGAEASLVASMGRMAAHTGQMVTYDQMLSHEHEFAPDVDKLNMDSAAPLTAGPDGRYPVPQPGITVKREY